MRTHNNTYESVCSCLQSWWLPVPKEALTGNIKTALIKL